MPSAQNRPREMTTAETVDFLRRAHYHLMDHRSFWNDRADISAARILCVTASDLQAGFEREPRWHLKENVKGTL